MLFIKKFPILALDALKKHSPNLYEENNDGHTVMDVVVTLHSDEVPIKNSSLHYFTVCQIFYQPKPERRKPKRGYKKIAIRTAYLGLSARGITTKKQLNTNHLKENLVPRSVSCTSTAHGTSANVW